MVFKEDLKEVAEMAWGEEPGMVQYSFTSTETRRLVKTDSSERPPQLSHSSLTMSKQAAQRMP